MFHCIGYIFNKLGSKTLPEKVENMIILSILLPKAYLIREYFVNQAAIEDSDSTNHQILCTK